MIFFFHGGICLLLIMLQTVVFPKCLPLIQPYDLFIPFILYLSFSRPLFEGVTATVVFGLILDNISAGPVGLYGTIYLWMYIMVRWGISILHIDNYTLLVFGIAAGVFLENLFICGAGFLWVENGLSQQGIRIIVEQIVGACMTGPLLFAGFGMMYRKWRQWVQLLEENKGSPLG